MAATLLIIGAAIFVFGAAVGAILLVSVGIKAEELDFRQTGRVSLRRRPPGLSSWSGRAATGLHVRQRADAPPLRPVKHDLPL